MDRAYGSGTVQARGAIQLKDSYCWQLGYYLALSSSVGTILFCSAGFQSGGKEIKRIVPDFNPGKKKEIIH